MNLNKSLKKIFIAAKSRKRIVLLSLVVFFLVLMYVEYFVLIPLIIIASLSKFYHRFFKSSLGIDLVLFTSITVTLSFKSIFLGLGVGWLSLILSELIAGKLSHTSLVSLFSLTVVILFSSLFMGRNTIFAMIILTLLYELIAGIFYHFLGSSPSRIFLFVSSHLFFNLFIILSFAIKIKEIII